MVNEVKHEELRYIFEHPGEAIEMFIEILQI